MNTHRIVTLETTRGEGDVYREGNLIARARYNLEVTQKMIQTSSDEIPGMKNVSGQIEVIEGEDYLFDYDFLTLHLNDGRGMEFFVTKVDISSGVHSVQHTGGKGLFTLSQQ